MASDTLRHQPMGASHMTMLQLRGAYRVLCPALVAIYSCRHSVSTSNEDGSHDCAPVMWAYGILCPAMVSPNVKQQREDMLLYPDHYLVWYAKVDSGPHSEKVMFSVLAVCSLGVSHVTNTWQCSNLFTSDPPVSTLVHPHPHEDFSHTGTPGHVRICSL